MAFKRPAFESVVEPDVLNAPFIMLKPLEVVASLLKCAKG